MPQSQVTKPKASDKKAATRKPATRKSLEMKVILKILLSIALLGVVVGVSYLKTIPAENLGSGVGFETQPATETPEASVATESDKKDGEEAITLKKEAPTKQNKTSAKTSQVTTKTPTEPPKILTISAKSDSGQTDKTQTGPTTAANSANTDAKVREEQIIIYFKDRLKSLPDDLSSYEKKVAIKEVRDETCDLFHISRTKLNQLAKLHKIAYP